MRRRRGLGAAAAAAALVGGALIAGVPPHALGWHDTGITQSLPVAEVPEVWAGVPLDNTSAVPITMQSLTLTGVHDLVVGRPFVIEYPAGDYIDWYPPPGTPGMVRAAAHRLPLAGFTVPPHTRHRFEAVVLVRARSTAVSASTSGAIARYTSGGVSWQETWIEHSSLRLGR